MPVTKEQITAQLQIAQAVADAIRELGSIPSGHLYAQLMGQMTIEAYESIISLLIDAKMVSRSKSHLLTWVG